MSFTSSDIESTQIGEQSDPALHNHFKVWLCTFLPTNQDNLYIIQLWNTFGGGLAEFVLVWKRIVIETISDINNVNDKTFRIMTGLELPIEDESIRMNTLSAFGIDLYDLILDLRERIKPVSHKYCYWEEPDRENINASRDQQWCSY